MASWGKKKITLLSFGPKKRSLSQFCNLRNIVHRLPSPVATERQRPRHSGPIRLRFVIRMSKASQSESQEFTVQTLASIGNSMFHGFHGFLFFHFTLSVMHKHCRTKQTAAATTVSYSRRMSVNNNPVSSKRNHGYHSTNNVIIAHARMRTPTEELEYACLAAWFHSSTCNLFFCVFF